jgi:hypothetical protein
MTKEIVKVFAFAVRVVVFLERGCEGEWGGDDPVVLFGAA